MAANSTVFQISRFLGRKLWSHSLSKPGLILEPSPVDTTNSEHTLVFDVENALLMSSSTFPYFMLVALEGGSLLRAFLLLFLYPVVWFLGEDEEMGMKLMAFVSFCGLRRDGFRVGRAILPKHFLESIGMEGVEVVLRGACSNIQKDSSSSTWKRRVGVSHMPDVMVESFLKEYLGVDVVVGMNMKVVGGFYTGIMEENKNKEELVLKELFGSSTSVLANSDCVVGFTGSSSKWCKTYDQFFSKCNKVLMVNEYERERWHAFPKERCPNPVVFHDGRIAFLPTPMATLAMFMWFPFGLLLAVFRSIIFVTLPYKLSAPILSLLGMKMRVINNTKTNTDFSSDKNHLFVCNHRTLLDPVYVSVAIGKEVTAVTYSMSRVSEILSPIKTVRLTRNREEDKRRMNIHLKKGALVVCPEGTTCREPFLLRFSPLFTELADEVVPVAVNPHFSMFYGTTAGGFKAFDPLFFLMNPSCTYEVEFLEKIETSMAVDHNYGIANKVQKALAEALGFKCTTLKRKDKYLMLAGNEGVVTY